MLELLQEADVVLEEHPQVGDPVLEHRDPLDAHAEGEALHRLGVVAALATNPKTFGSTIPAPRISIQPVPLHSGSRPPPSSVPLPPQAKQETSTWTLGSVNGK